MFPAEDVKTLECAKPRLHRAAEFSSLHIRMVIFVFQLREVSRVSTNNFGTGLLEPNITPTMRYADSGPL